MQKQRKQLSLHLLYNHPKNPRKQLTVEDLTDSITESGQLVPILVRPFKDGYQIISGHRRRLAMERLGFLTADCDVVDMDDEQAFNALMTTNIQSHSLSEIEEAEGIKHMMDTYEWTAERVSKEFGKERRWVFYRLQLLGLDHEVKEQVHSRALSPTHAREIAQLPHSQQVEVARQVVGEKLSTRETAELVKQIKEPEIPARTDNLQIDDSYFVRNTDEAVRGNQIDIVCNSYKDQKDEISPLETESQNNKIYTLETVNDFVRNSYEGATTECENHSSLIVADYDESTREKKPISNTVRASNYLTKFYEFLANFDESYIDSFMQMDELMHCRAVIQKAKKQLDWMEEKIINHQNGEITNVVEFRKKDA